MSTTSESSAPPSQLTAGFADPVADAQRCFRAVLDAMARPGSLHQIPALHPPAPLGIAAAAVLLTLVDQETPLWIDPAFAPARGWIAFHCGAPLTPDMARAAFALVADLPDLSRLAQGTHEAPETAATVILQLPTLQGGRGWRLSGPGLRVPALLQADGLGADFADRWAENRAGFPCGVDLVLCAGDRLAALPRSIAVTEA